jgi:predicted metal-binding membrane protein
VELNNSPGQFNDPERAGEDAARIRQAQLNAMLEQVLRRDRYLVAGALILVTLLSWAWIMAGAGMGMSGVEMTRHTMMGMNMMAPGAWDGRYILLMFFMWWIMMIAMMLPSATPVILLAAALNRRSTGPQKPFGSSAAFTFGYLSAWAGFSLAAVAVQWALQDSGLVSGMLRSTSWMLSMALLLAAGAWQFTPWKHACLRHCRGPVEFLTGHAGRGAKGAFMTGLHHGLYCLGCCWFLMALLFIGGVMNLFWIAGLAIYVWVEKILPFGERAGRIMGILLIAWGTALLIGHLAAG